MRMPPSRIRRLCLISVRVRVVFCYLFVVICVLLATRDISFVDRNIHYLFIARDVGTNNQIKQ